MPADDEIVVTATPLSRYDYQPVTFFNFDFATFTPLQLAPGTTLGGQIAVDIASAIKPITDYAPTDKTPLVRVIAGPSEDTGATISHANDVATLLSVGSNLTYVPGYAKVLQDMTTNHVTWNIQVVDSWASVGIADSTALAVTLGLTKTDDALGHFTDGTVLNTYILAPYATGSQFAKIVVHELTHAVRGSDGHFLVDEGMVNAIAPDAYNKIFNGISPSFDGSATNSLVIQAGDGNNIVYGTQGNDIITTGNGSNTVVAYTSNSFIQTGGGNDYVEIVGEGAKFLKDSGGVNSLYLSWMHSPSDLVVDYADNKAGRIVGNVTLAPASGGSNPFASPTRVTIENFATSGYYNLSYDDAGGARRTVLFSALLPSPGPQVPNGLADRSPDNFGLTQSTMKISGTLPFVANPEPSIADKVIGHPVESIWLPVQPSYDPAASTSVSQLGANSVNVPEQSAVAPPTIKFAALLAQAIAGQSSDTGMDHVQPWMASAIDQSHTMLAVAAF